MVSHADEVTDITLDESKFLQIWKDLLKSDIIGVNDDFFEIGGDSLLANTIHIRAIKEGINIKYEDIFKYRTIRNILKKKEDTYQIDIDNYDYSDINKIISVNDIKNIPKVIKKKELGNILLTGATGFVGAHILSEFLKEEKGIAYCLVRGKNIDVCKERLKSVLNFYFQNKYTDEIDKRIQVVNGDMVDENLKLDSSIIQYVANNITTVIHVASLVKHYGNKDQFFAINVIGTKNIVDFCTKHNKKLVYISTLGVAGIMKDKKLSEKDLYIEQTMDTIYTYTKFLAERLILENMFQGLNAIIIRLGNVINRYEDYKFQNNYTENRFINTLKTFINIKNMPNSFKNKEFEISPVDYVSKAIIKLIQYPSNANVFNLVNVNTINGAQMVEAIRDMGIDIQFLKQEEFTKLIQKIILEDPNSNILYGINNYFGKEVDLDFGDTKKHIDADFTLQYLKEANFEWPVLNENYIKNVISYFKDIKYFNF
ncbi:MAG: SDR family oxidoreductase [Oscillospiraceae bacterium]|nr:SDR family oxidoreductase [Oscillospiraceae bacterium]